jgi:hypothetical protein
VIFESAVAAPRCETSPPPPPPMPSAPPQHDADQAQGKYQVDDEDDILHLGSARCIAFRCAF